MAKTDLLDTARRVIELEARALDALRGALDTRFGDALDVILAARGRVIVTGIGKSGHIAHKIAATLASTGTPAQFVHPAEASHGDLGMVTRDDVVLAISNSGEAPELANVISFAKRFDIPLIGLTSNPDSSLGRQSGTILQIPKLGEACGTGIVPSISTTMTLALGDALAIALMEHRQFSPENFREFHPGGKLGARLSKVADLMHRGEDIPLIDADAEMQRALLEMTQKSFGVVGVIDPDGALIGIITDGDLRRHMDGLLTLTARDVMSRDPRMIGADDLAETAVGLMNRHKITCLFVANPQDRTPLGILHIHDCLRAGVA